jgi:predicted transcriptional regulator
MPLDDEMRAKVQTLAKDYPRKKMRVVSSAGAALGDQSREGGSIPTTTLEAKGTTHG